MNKTDTESVQPTAQNALETTPAGGALVVSRTARALAEASLSANTRASYASALRRLDDWLAARPAPDEILAGYLSELFDAGKASASASMVVAAVRFRARLSGLESPTGPATERVLAGFRRKATGRGRGQAKPCTADNLAAILATAALPRTNGRGTESDETARARGLDKVSGVSVTQSELADALGVSTRTIERWAAAGMPVLEQRAAQGRPRYNLAQCRKWAAERPTQGRHKPARAKGAPELSPRALEDPEKVELTPAERLTKARATDLEIKLHQRRGNILTKSEVETEWTRQGRAVRAAMLEVPAAVAIRYPGVEGLEDTCRHLIIDAMKHLAAGYKARQA